MTIENLTTIEALEGFIQGNQAVAFIVLGDKHERYQFVQKTLIKFRYITLSKLDKGVVNRYIRKITGYSRQQLTRLIKQYKEVGRIKWYPCRSNGFSTIYDEKDIKLLVEMDTRHEDICGHRIARVNCRLKADDVSKSHIYNKR